MGKRRVHVIVVRKRVTIALLVVTTAAMLGLVYVLSGKVHETQTTWQLIVLVVSAGGGDADALIALLMPVAANALVFVPWGFLAFVAIDSRSRPRSLTYALTIAGGALFALAADVWQWFLPTRVTTAPDVLANAAGTMAGAVLAHLRKQVRVRFDA